VAQRTTIRLLGEPVILRDDGAAPGPRGRKAWALLVYLLLAERPPTRRRLAELLFADAADPLGALRWNLAQLRRALGTAAVLEGDPLRLVLGPEVSVDIRDAGAPAGGLLEGIEFGASPAFESWLMVERRRYAGQAAAVLHESALSELAAGRPDRASELAARLVALEPFDEGHHELLVRSLAAGGDHTAALAQAAACRRLFRQELGREPSRAVREAARPPVGDAGARGDRVAALTHLSAGEAAVAAGAVEHGVDLLRQASAEASGCRDGALNARALLALGTALVHAVRGRDEEGAAVLHEALAAAEAAGDRETLVVALRELAYTGIQAGRRASVERWLARADRLAVNDAEHAAILWVQGMNRSDMGDYAGARTSLARAVEHSERAGDDRQTAFALSLIGRAHLLRGETDESVAPLDRALALVESERWLAFRPFPEALRGEADLHGGQIESAGERLEHAFTLGCTLGDPCWEGLAARNIGLLHRARGEMDAARDWMDQARERCVRHPDRYVWMQGYVLDAAIRLGLEAGEHDHASDLNRALGALAARTEMRELVVRSLLHAARLGESGALDSARMLGAELDNPALSALLTATR